MNDDKLTETGKLLGDIGAVGVWLAAMAEWLPAMAALASLVWALIRIYETDTVQKMLGRKKDV